MREHKSCPHSLPVKGCSLLGLNATVIPLEQMNDAVTRIFFAFVVGALWAPATLGQPYVLERPPGAQEGNFGRTVDLDSDRAVVAGHWADKPVGGLWVYERQETSWSFSSAIVRTNIIDHEQFGSAFDLEGDRLLVGAPGADTVGVSNIINDRAGRAFLYEWNGASWEETDAFEAQGTRRFGKSVAVSEDRLAVLSDSAVYLYEQHQGVWSDVAVLRAPYSHSGLAGVVALEGDWVFASGTNAVFFYTLNDQEWTLVDSLSVSVNDLSVSGEHMVTCSPYAHGGGRADVFAWDGTNWSHRSQLSFTSPIATTTPGRSDVGTECDIDGPLIVVGTQSRWAHVFSRGSGGWQEVSTLFREWFSGPTHWHVALDGDRVIIGGLASGASGGPVVYEGLVLNNVAVEEAPTASSFALMVYPNPTAGVTRAEVRLSAASSVLFEVFDVLGRSVWLEEKRAMPVGEHLFDLDLSVLSNGLYLVRATAGERSTSRGLLVVK